MRYCFEGALDEKRERCLTVGRRREKEKSTESGPPEKKTEERVGAFSQDTGAKSRLHRPLPEPGQNGKIQGETKAMGIPEHSPADSGTGKKPGTGRKSRADSQGNPAERFSGKGSANQRTGGKSSV